jgi:hypothetical protein
MLSLAALRYRNVLAAVGGPIERLEITDVSVLGEPGFMANAYLRAGLKTDRIGRAVFSGAHGSGTASSPMVARFMAVSEAMERWAHWQLHTGSERHRFGFDIDPSSNGMAAFPGLWRRQARTSALMEAAERFNVLNWWEGRLAAMESGTRWPGVRAATICSDAPGLTVILFKQTEAGFVAYGHAAALDFDSACRKAAVELQRHEQAVAHFALSHAGRIRNQLPPEAHPIERRSLFFALEEGHELFLERLRSRRTRPAPILKVVFDGFIPGPWSRYSDVWRVVYEPPSNRFLGLDENYFMW